MKTPTGILVALIHLAAAHQFKRHARKSKAVVSLLSLALLFASAAFAPAANLLAPGQAIVGVAATPGSSVSSIAISGSGGNTFPAAESPPNSIDASTGTKYLNFAKINCGFIVTIPNSAVNVTGFQFSTANDATERDPTVVTIEGTSSSDPTTAAGGASWTQIYSGVSGLTADPGRLTAGGVISFANTLSFNTYRLLITDVRNQGSANSMQFSEIQFTGLVAPDTNAPTLFSVSPVPGTTETLNTITVNFSEAVAGVNASDLLVNGSPATGVSGVGSNYTFTFPPLALGTVDVTFATNHGITDFGNPPNPFDATVTNATWQYNYVDVTAPTVFTRSPSGNTVNQLDTIQVNFSETVNGVDAADLLINGVPATNIVYVSPSIVTFQFAPPPTGAVTVAFAPGHGITDVAGNAFAGLSWNYTLDPNATVISFYISEFLASNSGHGTNGIRDEDGDGSDWVEIYNTDSSVSDIGGWFLTDTTNNLVKWRFPAGMTIPGHGYLVVFASGKNRTNILAKLHTNFQLSGGGEYLALVNQRTQIVSHFYPTFPSQTTDVSYGRDRVNPNIVGYFPVPTPGADNTPGTDPGLVVNFSRTGGTFSDVFQLALSTSDTNNKIYYNIISTAQDSTTATNIPGTNATLYTGPINMTNSVQVRVRAFPANTNSFPGPAHTECYIQVSAGITNFVSPLPIVVISTLNTAGLSGGYPTFDNSVSIMCFDNDTGSASIMGTPQMVKRAGINLRGSSTQGFPKSSFAVELWDEFNNDEEASFAGLPSESDWVLYAPNQFDNVLIHNPLMHQFGQELGHYSSRTRFVEVFFRNGPGAITATTNSIGAGMGDYYGVFVLEEKVKVDNNRVSIAALAPEQTNSAVISGGYLVKIDRADGNERSFVGGGETIVYQTPDGLEMVTAARAPQAAYLSSYFNLFNNGITGAANLTNVASTNHYSRYLDVDYSIDLHIVNTLTLNVDGYRLSGYIFKERGGKMKLGPLWDCDRGQGTSRNDGRALNPRCWQASNPSGDNGTDNGTDFFQGSTSPGWLGKLFSDIDFWQKWIDRYQDLRATVLDTNHIAANIDLLANPLREAQVRETKRWGGNGASDTNPRNGVTTTFSGDYTHTFPGTYQGEIDFQKRWYIDRVNFMDTNFLGRPSPSIAEGMVALGTVVALTDNSGKAGTKIYYTLNGSDPRGFQGTTNPAAILYTGPITITNNVRVRARAVNPNHRNMIGVTGVVAGHVPNGTRNPVVTSPWSGDKAATYFITTPPLVITELMFHPATSNTDTNDPDNYEFIELKNIGSNTLNLVGFKFTNGIDFTFSATNNVTNLVAGGYVLIVKHLAAFTNRYGVKTNIAGVYDGSLDNGGERISFVGPALEPILDFTYSDGWFPLADGLGFSLVIQNENAPLNTWGDKSSWRISSGENGSPGITDPPAPSLTVVLINEAMTHGILDTIELFNPGTNDANISGWFLSDSSGNPKKFQIPDNTIVPSGGFILFDETQFNSGPNAFGLSSGGDQVFLFSATNGLLTGYEHGFDFGPAATNVTFGRYVNSQGAEDFVAQSTNTLGATNGLPLVGPIVISEIMYHPPDGLVGTNLVDNSLDEFIELYNITTNAVLLYNPAHASNTWHLNKAVSFDFPTNISLASTSFALVVNFNPNTNALQLAAFRAKYGVSNSIPIFGPYSGKLDNSTEGIKLARPDDPTSDGSVSYIVVDRIDYADHSPWPIAADGLGASLQRLVFTDYGNDPTNWTAAAASASAPFRGGTLPSITQQPSNTFGLVGQSANFTAAASGTGVSLQWRLNGDAIPGATNAVLTITNLQVSVAGVYSVVAFNGAGAVFSSNAVLSVLTPVAFTLQPTNQNVQPGASVTLVSAAFGFGNGPVRYQWRFEGTNIPNATNASYNFTGANVTNHHGNFSVVATDDVSSAVSSNAFIYVLVKVGIVTHIQSTTILQGGTAVFTVVATGAPPLWYRWIRGGAPFLTNTSPVLVLTNVQVGGSYRVGVTNAASPNGVFSPASGNVTLNVLADFDQDGIADIWEAAYFGNASTNDPSNALLDPDGDGMNNRDEYIAGTNPTNALSVLKIVLSATNASQLEFLAQSNVTYSVQTRTDLATGVWTNLTNIGGQTGVRTIQVNTASSPPLPQRYYRIVTPLVP